MNYNDYIVMFVIMILSGLLITMTAWVDKWSDIYEIILSGMDNYRVRCRNRGVQYLVHTKSIPGHE